MTQAGAIERISTQRRETGRLMPRRFSKPAWYRFSRDRRRRYLARLPGQPSERDAARIDAMVRLEWQALKAEAEGTLQADREAREHRRLLDRLVSDFERSLASSPAAKPTAREILAAIHNRPVAAA
jgi:hypothetical protein